ncbi:MAG: hypothetical protein LBM04_10560, partial [Opitutaceae bacterium]|nr:hypothetical protein [Opitutaceae bacterium]
KYPKGEKIARDIAKAADFLGVSVNQNTLSSYLSGIYRNLFTQVNGKIKQIIDAGSITQNATRLHKRLVDISKVNDPNDRANQLTELAKDGSGAGSPRSLAQAIGMRMKAAYCGCDYAGLSAAETIFEPLSKWANSPPEVTASNAAKVLEELLKIALAAKKLPDGVKLMPVTP